MNKMIIEEIKAHFKGQENEAFSGLIRDGQYNDHGNIIRGTECWDYDTQYAETFIVSGFKMPVVIEDDKIMILAELLEFILSELKELDFGILEFMPGIKIEQDFGADPWGEAHQTLTIYGEWQLK